MNDKITVKSSNIVILLGFVSILVLLTTIVSISLFSISSNNDSIVELVDEQTQVTNIFTMRDSAQRRALGLYRMMAIDDPFERDDYYLEFKSQAQRFILARDDLLTHTGSTSQINIWKSIQDKVIKGSEVQNKTVEFIQQEDYKKADSMLLTEVIPIQDQVAEGFTSMLSNQNQNIDSKLKSAQDYNTNKFITISILGFIILLLGVAITIYVYMYNSKVEAALVAHSNEAEAANIAKSAFLANMSHEIRTPLTAIIGFSEQLAQKSLSDNERDTINNTIIRNSKHLQQLINDTLDLSKIEAGQLEVELTATSPLQVTYETESIMAKQAIDKGLAFKVFYDFPLPSTIITDPIRLKQILLNLCSNAIKFTHQGEINLHAKYDDINNQVQFIVKDSGIGISHEKQEKIFKPFTQSDTSTTRKYGGTGLGLSISRLLAEKLDGKLEVSSEKDQGSEFTLTINTGITGKIKMIESLEHPLPQLEVSYEDVHIRKLKGKVLLAEDTMDNQELISLYLKPTGLNLEIVSNGEEAVEKAMSGNFDLILMDMQMPIMDGLTATKKLRELGYDKPIVTLSANALLDDKQACLESGASLFLAKPIIQAQFYDALNLYLEEHASYSKKAEKLPVQTTISDTPSAGMNKLITKFVDGLTEKINELNESVTNKDFEKIDVLSHRLKGMGTSFGFPEISKLAAEINEASRDNDIELVSSKVKLLTDTCLTIINTHQIAHT